MVTRKRRIHNLTFRQVLAFVNDDSLVDDKVVAIEVQAAHTKGESLRVHAKINLERGRTET